VRIGHRQRTRGSSWWAPVAMVAVLVAACGGGAESDPIPDTTVLGSVTTVGDQTQTTVPETSPVSPDPDEGSEQGEGAEGEFCQMMEADALRTYDVFDPAIVEEYFTENLVFLSGLEGRVPAEIAADFEVVHRNAVELAALLAEHDYVMTAVPEADLEAMASDEVLEASTRIRDYCGFDLG